MSDYNPNSLKRHGDLIQPALTNDLNMDTFNSIAEDFNDPVLFVLKKTTHIFEEELENLDYWDGPEAWRKVYEMYKKAGCNYTMALATLANAILTHESSFFSLSRDSFYNLVKNDPNHVGKAFSLSSAKFNSLLKFFYDCHLITRVEPSIGRKAGIFRCINNVILHDIWDFKLQTAEVKWASEGHLDLLAKELKQVYDWRESYKPSSRGQIPKPLF